MPRFVDCHAIGFDIIFAHHSRDFFGAHRDIFSVLNAVQQHPFFVVYVGDADAFAVNIERDRLLPLPAQDILVAEKTVTLHVADGAVYDIHGFGINVVRLCHSELVAFDVENEFVHGNALAVQHGYNRVDDAGYGTHIHLHSARREHIARIQREEHAARQRFFVEIFRRIGQQYVFGNKRARGYAHKLVYLSRPVGRDKAAQTDGNVDIVAAVKVLRRESEVYERAAGRRQA